MFIITQGLLGVGLVVQGYLSVAVVAGVDGNVVSLNQSVPRAATFFWGM